MARQRLRTKRRKGKVLAEALYVALTRARTQRWVSGLRVPAGHAARPIIDAVERASRS